MPESRSPPRAYFLAVVLVTMGDAAARALLPASLKGLETSLEVGPGELGLLALCQSLSLSGGLLLWGWALESGFRPANLLGAGCMGWGAVAILLSLTSDFRTHVFLRALNGACLSAAPPMVQAIVTQIVPPEGRGRAFGRLEAAAQAAQLLTVTWATTSSGNRWRHSHIAAGLLSLAAGAWALMLAPGVDHAAEGGGGGAVGSFGRMMAAFRRMVEIPSFLLLVGQGVTGGVPWNAMGFLPMYFLTMGYPDAQAGLLGAALSLGGVTAALVGGPIGDWLAARSPEQGRVHTAIITISLGIPAFWAVFHLVPPGPEHFTAAAAALFTFGLVGTWCNFAANRPICAELVRTPSERGQIVALWMAVEGTSSAVFGAPLVGFLSERMGYVNVLDASAGASSAQTLADALWGVASVAWGLSLCCWFGMLHTFPRDRRIVAAADNGP